MILSAAVHITWVKVEKPTFDLIGVVLGSLALSAMLAAAALLLGLAFALVLIRRDRRKAATLTPLLGLDMKSGPP